MRPSISLDNAVQQIITEASTPKLAASATTGVGAPATDLSGDLRKLAAALRTAPVPDVTFEDLHRVKELVYGR